VHTSETGRSAELTGFILTGVPAQRARPQAESFRREKLPQCSVCAGRTILGVVVVLDLEGFSLAQFAAAKDFLAEISRLDQDGG
jgi:hypothetical protein